MKLSVDVFQRLHSFRQVGARQPEAGGILLGRYIVDSEAVVVDEVSSPMPGDRRTRFSFFRHQRAHQWLIEQRWKESEGTCHYLGEWHTHPEATPTPSLVDLSEWRRRLAEDRFEAEFLLFVIVGTQQVRMWEGRRRSGVILPLEEMR
ncbi:hypothetical protein CYFUS_000655 [Cystobacter fuscus]|uniref:JAB domain-containing protein n=1 Tax=Cystobacter fuscus TaxID=43 RepID=A0A250IVF7_9BACT|nr:Mov34/MPN/PAD-1 family protein [Cystobacter fuscus]ATB35243.1 hypothetical protein CYFUS_000655 [Cystobacter fuscus]